MRTHLETLADWAISLRAEHIPARVLAAAGSQLRSVLGSLYAGAASPAGRLCRRAALGLASAGGARVLPSGEATSPFAAVLANAACSMAHDFDDYLFLGHTGHSAVLAALAVAEEVERQRRRAAGRPGRGQRDSPAAWAPTSASDRRTASCGRTSTWPARWSPPPACAG